MEIKNLKVTSTFFELVKKTGIVIANKIKENKARITSAFLALAMTASFSLMKPEVASAEENRQEVVTINSNVSEPEYVPLYENNEPVEITNIQTYYMYTVQSGDNASVISRRICRQFGVEPTTKYWPVIAYLNNYPRIIHPGDIIYYPTTMLEMDAILEELKETGWYRSYVRLNRIYKRNDGILTLGEIIDDIYGRGASQNRNLVDAYLSRIGLNGRFDRNSVIFDGNLVNPNYNLYFIITEDIPTMEELREIMGGKNKGR